MVKNKYVLVFGITQLLIGCILPSPKFGMDFNRQRLELGLELLKKGWVASSVSDKYTIWKTPELFLKENTPMFFSISATYNSTDQIESESDLYYSGKKFKTIDGEESETLTVKYFFVPTNISGRIVHGWYCSHHGFQNKIGTINSIGQNVDNLRDLDVDIRNADSILRSWGFSPPKRKLD